MPMPASWRVVFETGQPRPMFRGERELARSTMSWLAPDQAAWWPITLMTASPFSVLEQP